MTLIEFKYNFVSLHMLDLSHCDIVLENNNPNNSVIRVIDTHIIEGIYYIQKLLEFMLNVHYLRLVKWKKQEFYTLHRADPDT